MHGAQRDYGYCGMNSVLNATLSRSAFRLDDKNLIDLHTFIFYAFALMANIFRAKKKKLKATMKYYLN